MVLCRQTREYIDKSSSFFFLTPPVTQAPPVTQVAMEARAPQELEALREVQELKALREVRVHPASSAPPEFTYYPPPLPLFHKATSRISSIPRPLRA
jgi:hypothetical protein